MARWLLESIDVSGGFLAGLQLQLPPGLTCIIGPRGSGKSTLAEVIRYGIGGIAGAAKFRSDLVQANLGAAIITLHAKRTTDSTLYTVTRSFRQLPILTTNGGSPVTGIDLDRGTFLPIDGYSNAEIEAIATESLGDKRRALLDELKADELRAIDIVVRDMHRSLQANADRIRSHRRTIADITEQIEEIGDARGIVKSLPDTDQSDLGNRLTNAARQQGHNKQEAADLDRKLNSVLQLSRELTSLIGNCTSELSKPITALGEENEIIARAADRRIAQTANLLATYTDEIVRELADAHIALLKIKDDQETLHFDQAVDFNELQEENAAASEAVNRRTLAERAVANLESLESKKATEQALIADLLEERRQQKTEYISCRQQISIIRSQVANELQCNASASVRVRVETNSDLSGYQQLLAEGLRGSRLRNHEDIVQSLLLLRPEQLSQIIQNNDYEELDCQTSLGRERTQRILESFVASLDPFAVEVVDIEDKVCIELNVSKGSEPLYKDASELSRGQKCTALLPILLARRDTPLVIDQPEDNLDNHFIYENVVENILKLKSHRQMIFITHNANIPVLAEAELIVVLNSDGKQGYVEKIGTLDQCRNEIVDLLEGGEKAFELRRQRYART